MVPASSTTRAREPPVPMSIPRIGMAAPFSETRSLRPVRLPPDALGGDALRGKHLVLQRVHAGRGLVDGADEGDRSLQDRLELLLVLDTCLRVLVLDDQVRVGHVE